MGLALDEPHRETWALGGGAGNFGDTHDGVASCRRRARRLAPEEGGAAWPNAPAGAVGIRAADERVWSPDGEVPSAEAHRWIPLPNGH